MKLLSWMAMVDVFVFLLQQFRLLLSQASSVAISYTPRWTHQLLGGFLVSGIYRSAVPVRRRRITGAFCVLVRYLSVGALRGISKFFVDLHCLFFQLKLLSCLCISMASSNLMCPCGECSATADLLGSPRQRLSCSFILLLNASRESLSQYS